MFTHISAAFAVLAVALQWNGIRSPYRCRVLGLLIAAIFLFRLNSLFLIFPFLWVIGQENSFCLFRKKQRDLSPISSFNIKKDSFGLFLLFIIAGSGLCSISPILTQYGEIILPFNVYTAQAEKFQTLGLLLFPILFGYAIDKKGALWGAVVTSLIGEIALFSVINSTGIPFLLNLSGFLLGCGQSGFFLIIPPFLFLICGPHPYKRYCFITYGIFFLFRITFDYIIVKYSFSLYTLSYILGTTLWALCLAATAVYCSWHKRLGIIIDNGKKV